mgnify:CR=1 FL=1
MSKETKVKIYDPSVDAYREVPLSQAKKYLESLEDVKEAVQEAEEGE